MTDAKLREKLDRAVGNYCGHEDIAANRLPDGDCARCKEIVDDCMEEATAHVALARAAALLAAEHRVLTFFSRGDNWKPSDLTDAIRALTTADDQAALDKFASDTRDVMGQEIMALLSRKGIVCVWSHDANEPFTKALEPALDKYVQERVEAAEASSFKEGLAYAIHVVGGTVPEESYALAFTEAFARALAAAKQAGADERDQQWIDGMHAEDLSPRKPCDIAAYLKWFEGSCTSGYETELAELRRPSPCPKGHPAMFWVQDTWGPIPTQPPTYHCTICAEQAETERVARLDAITQCAIEAGERSPEGVSSHTMLGDMWDRCIAALQPGADKERK